MPTEKFQSEIAEIDAALVPGSPQWSQLLAGLGAASADVERWSTTIVPHQGLEHRMVLARVTVPLGALSSQALDLAVRLGLSMARVARESLTSRWGENSQQDG